MGNEDVAGADEWVENARIGAEKKGIYENNVPLTHCTWVHVAKILVDYMCGHASAEEMDIFVYTHTYMHTCTNTDASIRTHTRTYKYIFE